jgi:hypothetical protein
VREKVNAWIRASGEFDGVIDLDKLVRTPPILLEYGPHTTAGTICIEVTPHPGMPFR